MQFSSDAVRDLALLLQQTGLHEISFATQSEDATPLKIVVRAAPKAQRAPRRASAEAPAPVEDTVTSSTSADPAFQSDTSEPTSPVAVPVLATAVGLFVLSPDMNVGSSIKKGQVIATVESLKVPTEVCAPQNGTLHEVFVEDGQGVEYGQALLSLLAEE
jgi:acetyl-CoA carboxylase biotin carboxyl carrier protein